MRSWLVIPALGASCAGAAAGLMAMHGGAHAIAPAMVIACGAAGAGISACVRALAGDSPASLVGAMLAPLLFVATLFDSAMIGAHDARAVIAVAAAAWAAVELSRPSISPLVAVLPAAVACMLDASFVALLPIAAARVMTAPWERPKWAVAVPILSALVGLAAVMAYVAHGGVFAKLGAAWWGPRGPATARAWMDMCAREVGPVTAVAALGGVVAFARLRHAEMGLALAVVGAFAAGLRGGVVPPAWVGMAALAAGLGVARLAGSIRLAPGQAVVGATVAMLVVTVPAWSAVQNGRRVPSAHASR